MTFMLAACTASDPQTPSVTNSTPPPATSGSVSRAPATFPDPRASSAAGTAVTSSPVLGAVRGTVVVELVDSGLPAGTECRAMAHNTSQVTSGGGHLGGASISLGALALAERTEFALLPGTYTIRVHCSAETKTWAAEKDLVLIRRDQSTDVRLEPVPTP